MKNRPSTCGFTKSANIKITIDLHVIMWIIIIVRGTKRKVLNPKSPSWAGKVGHYG
jgi:hypothetical protein